MLRDMPPGKPFTKVSDEQRAAFASAMKKDGVDLLRSLGAAAIQHVNEHPDSMLTQSLMSVERDTGALTVLARGIKSLLRKDDEVPAPPTPAPSTKPSSSKPRPPIDAEFIVEKKGGAK